MHAISNVHRMWNKWFMGHITHLSNNMYCNSYQRCSFYLIQSNTKSHGLTQHPPPPYFQENVMFQKDLYNGEQLSLFWLYFLQVGYFRGDTPSKIHQHINTHPHPKFTTVFGANLTLGKIIIRALVMSGQNNKPVYIIQKIKYLYTDRLMGIHHKKIDHPQIGIKDSKLQHISYTTVHVACTSINYQ